MPGVQATKPGFCVARGEAMAAHAWMPTLECLAVHVALVSGRCQVRRPPGPLLCQAIHQQRLMAQLRLPAAAGTHRPLLGASCSWRENRQLFTCTRQTE